MDDLTYTDWIQIRRITPAREQFLELLANFPDFREAAESIDEEHLDLLEVRLRTLSANLQRRPHWDDYCAFVLELCQRFGIDSASWAPEAVHHVIARIVINQPTHHYMTFYHDPGLLNKRARVPETLARQVEMAFMRIVRRMTDFEIWHEFPDEHYDNIRQQVSRGARELGIKLR